MKKLYNIGLDIGTTSVGWAVVEKETNKIMRKGNKKLWGVRLFEEAHTAEERRSFRSTRRRYDRRRKRIKLLQEEFKTEIEKVDPDFFQKMRETFYNPEKDTINKTIKITEEEKAQIKKYHEKYPTIYHLRNELVNSKEQMDIRIVYMALHHIMKYRGNFLYEGDNFNISSLNPKQKLKEILENMINLCNGIDLNENYEDIISLKDFETIIDLESKNDQKIEFKKYFSLILNKDTANELTNLLIGNTFNIDKLFQIENEETIKISFKGSTYEEKYSELEKTLGEKIEVLENLKELYDIIFLKKFFDTEENSTISTLMIKNYNEHKNDLKALKQILKQDRKNYDYLLKSKEKMCPYELYIRNQITYDDWAKEIEKSISNIPLTDEISKMLEKINNGKFMPRITDKDNGKYPYQLHADELKKIIENQGKYYPFLQKTTNNNKYRLQELLEFRIPYYVGPLNNTTDKKDQKNKNAWLIKKTNERITPYNFKQIVNLEDSAEQFIERMISHCTYLLEEPALPNNSITYSKYKVRNELKQIRINNEKISPEFEEKIFRELFLTTSKTITDKTFKQYLSKKDEYIMYNGDLNITGYSADGKFANNMKSYIDFFGENGIFEGTNYQESDAELFIKWITIFESKEILEKKIIKEYPDIPKENLKRALNQKYTGWGNLSEKLLTTKYYKDEKTGTIKSILDLLETTSQNFLQILNDKNYKFQKMIEENNRIDANKKINYELVDDLATSPANKRGIYQALKVLEEIISYIGYEPENIAIEMARNEDKKGRKIDRKKRLMQLYEKNKKDIENVSQLKAELKNVENFTTKLFLYFIQEGKSLYSGTPLDILNLNEYEIDHIIPQTLKKDDSIDNKALVLREENQEKSASFVLPTRFQNNTMRNWWKHLEKIGLISSKKIFNLCRKEFKDSDIEGFINRQLVETRQITKHVANIVKNYYKNTDVIYLHADLSHNYREKFELFKYRQLNDFHHAHDAYLAAVLGEYQKYYFKDKIDFEKLKEQNRQLYEKKEYQKLKYGYVINSLDNEFVTCDENTGEILFDAQKFNQTIEKTMYQNDILISRKTEIKTGAFYDQTKVKASGKITKPISLKDNLPTSIYGGYKTLFPSYVLVVKYNVKGKEKQKIIGMPIYYEKKAKVNPELKSQYIKDILNLKENDSYEIIKDRIPFNVELNWNGKSCFLVGASVELCNAKEFKIDTSHLKEWKYTLNRLLNKKKTNDQTIEEYDQQLEEILQYILNKLEKEYALYNSEFIKIKEKLENGILEMERKETVIKELLNMLKCNSQNANLKEIGLTDRTGRKSNQTIAHAAIIHKSTTGIKEWKDEF